MSINEGYPPWCDPEKDRREELQRTCDELNLKIHGQFQALQQILVQGGKTVSDRSWRTSPHAMDQTSARRLPSRRSEDDGRGQWNMRTLTPLTTRRPEGCLDRRHRVGKTAASGPRYLPLPQTRPEYSNPIRLRSIMSSQFPRREKLLMLNPPLAVPKDEQAKQPPVRLESVEASTRPSTGQTSSNDTVFTAPARERSPSMSSVDSDYDDDDDDDDSSTEYSWPASSPPPSTTRLLDKYNGPVHERIMDNPFGRCGRCRDLGEQQRCVLPPPPWHWGYERYECAECKRAGGCCDNLPGLWEERI